MGSIEKMSTHMMAYGPVPSRRLGQSLGVNHVPPKVCTYACVYCQLGRTIEMTYERRKFYPPDEIEEAVKQQIEKTRNMRERIDYLTFVPDGEPTLDLNLGREIGLLKPLGIDIAVISNGSLIWRRDVRRDLMAADWVSLKVDAVTEGIWRRIDRPHGRLRLGEILEGMRAFKEVFEGELTTESMLVEGLNDGREEVELMADFIGELKPDKAYLAIPTRPPAEDWVRPPSEAALNEAYQIFNDRIAHVEYLIGYEGDAFAFTGNVEDDLLSITSVHPMREEGVRRLLTRATADWEVVERMIDEGKLVRLDYLGNRFYMRSIKSRVGSPKP
jgi:wyosine [tRNA(Phe)-imidazoG37] synthetase (radical SAM superfamily)